MDILKDLKEFIKQTTKENPDDTRWIITQYEHGRITLFETLNEIQKIHIEYQLSQDQQLELI